MVGWLVVVCLITLAELYWNDIMHYKCFYEKKLKAAKNGGK
jgi:hypothetical protein